MDDKPLFSDADVYTLIGHAEFLRRVRNEHDMPTWFYGLAHRIAVALNDPELAQRTLDLATQGAPE